MARVILRVGNLRESVAFWSEKVGLHVASATGSFAFLAGGDVELVLNEVAEAPFDRSLTEIVWEVSNVVATYEELRARGVPFEVDLRPVTTDGRGALMAAHFRDPDGHLASLTGWVEEEPPPS